MSGVFIDKKVNKENSIDMMKISSGESLFSNTSKEKRYCKNELTNELNKLCETENLGPNDYAEGDRLMSRFTKELNFISSYYNIKLPFKEHHKFLPDKSNNAKIVLHMFLNTLNKDLLTTYDEI